jgi:hypothetical protein
MRKITVTVLALALAGCASQREYVADHIRPQRHVVPAPSVKPKPAPVAAPVVAPTPTPSPSPAKPLQKPRWYDEFKASGSWIKSKVKGK